MKRIVIGTDGSPGALTAVETGLELACDMDAAVTIVSVTHAPPPVLGDPYYQRDVSAGLNKARAAVGEALQSATSLDVEAEVEIVEGDPADEILRIARARDADLIVVGSRERGPVVQALLGSVSRDVVHHADRPVLVAHGVKRERRAA